MPDSKNMIPIRHDGVEAYCNAYAEDPVFKNVVYLSLIGYKTALRALWAAFLDNQCLEYNYSTYYARSWFSRLEKIDYRAHAVTLPENGVAHLVLLAKPATRFAERGQPFYVLTKPSETTQQTVARFGVLLDQNVGVPLLPTWHAYLWSKGLNERLVVSSVGSDCVGVSLYRIDADANKWLALIEKGVTSGRLTP